MPIYRLLQEASFGQDEIDRITKAYDCALQELRLKDRTDPITEVVAKKIIDVARTERDPVLICAQALKELRGAGRL